MTIRRRRKQVPAPVPEVRVCITSSDYGKDVFIDPEHAKQLYAHGYIAMANFCGSKYDYCTIKDGTNDLDPRLIIRREKRY
jgi:hypothetical protein